MTTNPAPTQLPASVELAPNYTIPIVLIAVAIPIAGFQLWAGAAIGVFGLSIVVLP
jgi:hypothetical protein